MKDMLKGFAIHVCNIISTTCTVHRIILEAPTAELFDSWHPVQHNAQYIITLHL